MATKRRTPLTRERVVRAAIALADKGGVEAVSMRRLGQQLGVEAMSLYNHVANKGDLVDGMVDLVLSEIELPDGGDDWRADVRTCASSFHDALLRHPWACNAVLSPGSTPDTHAPRLQYMEWLLRRLREAGFTADQSYHAYHAIDAHILGFTLWQLGHMATAKELAGSKGLKELAARFLERLRAENAPYLAEHVEQHLAASKDEREFEFGLELILDGLEQLRRG